MANDSYRPVTKANPCRICGKPDWCKESKDGKFAICNRIAEGSVKTLKMGWLHKLKGDTTPKQQSKPLKLTEYATAKQLPISFLKTEFGIKEFKGGLAVPYKDDSGRIVATRFRLSMSGDKFRWKKGNEASEALYNAERLPEYAKKKELNVAEGESDTHTGHYHGLPVVGVPGKKCGLDHLAKKIVKHGFGAVYVVVEPDAKGQIEVDIASALSERQYQGKLFAITLPVKDLSELHCKYPDDFDKMFEQAKREASLVNIETKTLFDRLNDIRSEGLKQFERRSKSTTLIKHRLQSFGEFIKTNEGQLYYFNKIEKRLYTIWRDSGEVELLLYMVAGLNKADPDYLYIVNDLANYTSIKGRLTEVWQFARFQNSKLYISRFNGQVYIFDGKTIIEADNGTDGVLFLDHPDWQPWQLCEDNSINIADIIDSINFDDNEILNCQEYRTLFVAYLFGLFFKDLTHGAVLSAFVGEKGSGKTTIIRLMGKMLFGNGFEVRSVEKGKEDNFLVMISNQHFLGLDNLDGAISWLNDHLAAIATGTYITKRRLYTTNEEYRIKPRVFIAMSSRTPAFKRDDVADRLLIFRLKRFEKFIPERILLEQIIKNRNALMTQIAHDLNSIVNEVNSPINTETETDFRMADFAILGEKIWRAIGGDSGVEKFKAVISKMKLAQEAFSVEDDPLPDLITEWIEKNPCSTGITASKLFPQLKAIADEQHIPFNLKSVRSLGRQLSMIRQPLLELCGIKTSSYQGRGRTKYWVFSQVNDLDFQAENAGECCSVNSPQHSPIQI